MKTTCNSFNQIGGDQNRIATIISVHFSNTFIFNILALPPQIFFSNNTGPTRAKQLYCNSCTVNTKQKQSIVIGVKKMTIQK